RPDHQFQGGHAIQIDLIVLDLAGRASGTEIPLLPHDFLGLPAVSRRPSNGEFLEAVARGLQKMKLYSTHCQSLIEDQTDLLLALLRGAPARTCIGAEDGFDRKP